MRLFFVALVSCVVAVVACGRSAEPRVACPQPASDCADLLLQQADIEAVFAAGVAAEDAALADEAAQCEQLLIEVAVDKSCFANNCAELCRLHPCPGAGGEDAGSCAARCDDLLAAGTIDVVSLGQVLEKAGERPAFCTCRACTAPDDAFCTELFDCAD